VLEDLQLDTVLVIGVDPIEPFGWLVGHLLRPIPEKCLPPGGVENRILAEIPVPHARTRPAAEQGIALLELLQSFGGWIDLLGKSSDVACGPLYGGMRSITARRQLEYRSDQFTRMN
jgi:hypothetical protein